MQQVVCTKCRCSNQFGTIFCRNCGKKLPELDRNHPDRQLQNGMKDIFKRLMKLVGILVLLALIGAVVLPVGFKKAPELQESNIETTENNYELMAKRIAEGEGAREFIMTPEEAGYIATKFITPAPPEASEEGEEQATEDADAEEAETTENPGVITCATNKDELTIVYAKKYYKVLQCRIEITGKFTHEKIKTTKSDAKKDEKKTTDETEDDPEDATETEFKYTITKALIGHIPMPKFLFPQVLELFKTVVFNREIERGISLVKEVKIDSGNINLSFKKQIK